MTVIQYVYARLLRDWQKDVPGRIASVPEPYITMEDEDTEEKLRYKDVIKVADGGIQTKEPRDVHYESERILTLVNVDIRTVNKNRPRYNQAIGSPGRVRMFGYRDEQTLEAEDNGGLVGEASRVFKEQRRGDREFDLVEEPEVNDITNQTGVGHYRAVMTLRFDQRDAPIST